MSTSPAGSPSDRLAFDEDPTAQDIIDAMRIVLMAQQNPEKAMQVVRMLMELAPETDSNRGIDLLIGLISEASLKVEVVT